jgi:hypothetical protein
MEVRFPADADERACALRLVRDAYISRGYVQDLQPLDGDNTQVLVAVHDGTVIGTASTVLRSSGPLPTENYYGLSNLDERPGTVMEVGRLAVAHGTGPPRGMATVGLFAAVVLWGDHHRVALILACLKPPLRRRLAMLGIASELVAGPEKLIGQAIPPPYRGYFFPQSESQRPVAVLIRLDQVRAPLLDHLSAADGHITISPQIVPPPATCGPAATPRPHDNAHGPTPATPDHEAGPLTTPALRRRNHLHVATRTANTTGEPA